MGLVPFKCWCALLYISKLSFLVVDLWLLDVWTYPRPSYDFPGGRKIPAPILHFTKTTTIFIKIFSIILFICSYFHLFLHIWSVIKSVNILVVLAYWIHFLFYLLQFCHFSSGLQETSSKYTVCCGLSCDHSPRRSHENRHRLHPLTSREKGY